MPVYFMRLMSGGTIKIGCTDDVEERRGRLERFYKCKIRVLHVMEGGRKEEQEIHARFAHLRIGITEQFRPGPELMEFIGHPVLLDEDFQAARAIYPVVRSRRRRRRRLSRRVTSLKVTRRRITHNQTEEDFKKTVDKEIERLASQPAAFEFILPNVTITAEIQDQEEFVRIVCSELGEWHRWLNTVFGSSNKRKMIRTRSADEYLVMITGVFIRDGLPDMFSVFERQLKNVQQRGFA